MGWINHYMSNHRISQTHSTSSMANQRLNIQPQLYHLQGILLFSYLRIKHRELMRELRSVAYHLEKEIFPSAKNERLQRFVIIVERDENAPRLFGIEGRHRIELANCQRLAKQLACQPIDKVILDCHLEYEQIIDAVLLAFYVGSGLQHKANGASSAHPWGKPELIRAMKSKTGFHHSCSNLYYNRHKRTLTIEYSYCELFLSRVIKGYASFFPSFQDHRSYQKTALPAAAVVALASYGIGHLYMQNMIGLLYLWPAVIGGAVFIVFKSWAALLYDQEFRECVIQNYMINIDNLSFIPKVNPHPIVHLNLETDQSYMNPAASHWFRQLNLPGKNWHEMIPVSWPQIIETCCANGPGVSTKTEFEYHERFFQMDVVLFPDGKNLLVTWFDLTELRKKEKKIQELNARLEFRVEQRTKKLLETQDVTIQSLAGLAETRDPETGQHIQRTRLFVKVLAETLADNSPYAEVLTEEIRAQIEKMAPLHDIGKVGVPDSILLKPGRLTKDEFEYIKKHTLYGGDALEIANKRLGGHSFLKIGSQIAYAHHERWDGRGYPFGLKGEEIPLAARIMALADVYDALRTQRVYKEAYSHECAKQIILEGRGAQFDPAIVDAFWRCEAQFILISEQYQDAVDRIFF